MIEQTGLRPVDQLLWKRHAHSNTVGVHADEHPPQPLEHDLVDEAAAVPAVIDEQRLLVELRIELPHELLHAERCHVGEVHVGDPPARGLVDHFAVVVDPGLLAQRQLARHRLHREIAALAAGVVGDRQLDGAVLFADQQAVRINGCLQLNAVDGQQVISGVYLETRCRERGAIPVAGVVSRVDRRQPIPAGAALEGEIGAEECRGHAALLRRFVAAADVGVRVADLSEHLADEVVQVGARADQRQQPCVGGAHAGPIDPVHRLAEEEIALDPPGRGKHLRPLLRRLDAHPQVRQIELFGGVLLALARGRLGVRHEVVLVELVEHSLAVGRQHVAAQSRDDDGVLALLHVIDMQCRLLARQRALDHQARTCQVEDLIVTHVERADLGGRDGQRHRATHQTPEIDLHRPGGAGLPGGALGLRPVLALVAGLVLRLLALAALRLAGLTALLGSHGALVGSRRERGRRAALESGDIDACHLQRGNVELGAAERGVLMPRGEEEQIPAVPVEPRIVVIGARVAHPCGLVSLEAVEPDAALLVRAGDAVGQPAPIRRPDIVVHLDVRILRHLLRLPACDGHHPQPVLVVGKREALAAGRPARAIEIPAIEVGEDLLRATLGGPHGELLLPEDIGRVGDSAAVRRPARVVLVGSGSLCQVARVAVLRHHRIDGG